MKLLSLNKYISFLIIISSLLPVYAEEEIDIWNKKIQNNKEMSQPEKEATNKSIIPKLLNKNNNQNNIKIDNEILVNSKQSRIFGIYDPADNGFNLNMWSETSGEKVHSILARINKLNLSSTATKLFENTIYSIAYPPEGMSDEEFIDLKINWMIQNKREDLIEKFLKENETFHNKKKIVQYLVDKNIANANLKESCEQINFMDKNIKDPYLEKFKIYCLIFNEKKNEAQLLHDILKEQKQSDKFFDDKIKFLLGITKKTDNKIKDNNLLNFYLSSITIKNFKYEPTVKTKKIIWEYLNAANLIKLDDIEDKEKLKSLEIAANEDRLKKQKIFDIYKKISFDLNNLINAENIYQTLNNSDARAIIYQKFLLSDNNEKKIELLFLLKDLFKKDNLSNVYVKFMSDRLREIDLTTVSESYQETVEKNIIQDKELIFGKIKYDDKVLHRSKIIKYYTEPNEDQKKVQKDLDRVYKKIKKNKKYFFSAKDLALIESLEKDGFKIPKDLKYREIAKKYDIPSGLLELAKNNQAAFLTLKIVEIIGEDEVYNLDAETIYFISHLLNETKLKSFRNEILISGLPLRS
jgi:hypothetical protein